MQPQRDLLELQSSWLAPARSRLFRRIGIAHKRSILDLGAGYGTVSGELTRRSQGLVVALDILSDTLQYHTDSHHYHPVTGEAAHLPFASHSFDLVFCQCVLLWMNSLDRVIQQITRTLTPGGVLIAIEPDYDAMIEFPSELSTREMWLEAIISSGGDPIIGRRLPGLLEARGFKVQVGLLERIRPSVAERFLFLEELLEDQDHLETLNRIKQLTIKPDYAGWKTISHLPFFLITATKMQ